RLVLGELLLTEGRTREVEGCGDVGGLFLFHEPQEHPQESVHGVGVLPAGRREVGCREGIKGPEGQGMPVEQEQGFFRVTTGCHDRYPTELHPARCFVPTRALSYALTYCAPVPQLSEATDSKPVQCEFESDRAHDFITAVTWRRLRLRRGFLHFHVHLSGVAAGEELEEGLRHGLDAVTRRDVILNLPAGDQRGHPLPELPRHVEVLPQHEAAQGEALADRQ